MSISNKIRFAVVGMGHIGKRHATLIGQNPDAELVSVADVRDVEELGWTDAQTPCFSSIEDLLANGPDFDVLNVCTPNGLHARHCIAGLEAGKHVVCEKPMALSKADCEEVIYKALQVSRQVFVVMQNRYSPPSKWLKQLVSDKTLGDIFLVQVNCYWNRDHRYYKPGGWKGTKDMDGGVLFTQFSHFIDILYWVFGDISNIQARFENFNHQDNTDFEDSGLVSFKLMKGGMGLLSYTTSVWDKNLESSITVIGSKGSLKVGGQYMDKVEYCHIDGYTMPELEPTLPPNNYGPYIGSAANHHFIIQNVVDTLRNRHFPSTNALEGLKNVDIIERIYALKHGHL